MNNLHVEGVNIGDTFSNRDKVKEAGLHRRGSVGGHGISYCPDSGLAEAIVLSGGYEDDEDFGDLIYYTGQGGRGAHGRQTKPQEFVTGNKALWKSHDLHQPVRVIRGHQAESEWCPEDGYRYDGLYYVTGAWKDHGKSTFLVYRFNLEGVPGEFSVPGLPDSSLVNTTTGAETGSPSSQQGPDRREFTGSRIVRNSKIIREIKQLYDSECQICSQTIELPSGAKYAEGAHIHPLGDRHQGPDEKFNILCLCPNCHVLLDYGAIAIEDDHTVVPSGTKVVLHPEHVLEKRCIRYHRKTFYQKVRS